MALHTAIGQPLADFIDGLDEDTWYAFMAKFGYTIFETDLAFYKERIVQRVKQDFGVTLTSGEAIAHRTLEIVQELGHFAND